MIKQGLYHKDVYMPFPIQTADQSVKLHYTKHALDAAETDRYDIIELPLTVNLSHGTIIEIEIGNHETIEKFVIRFPYSETLDLCMVIIPDRLCVKTVWLNERFDEHCTLDPSRYVRKQ